MTTRGPVLVLLGAAVAGLIAADQSSDGAEPVTTPVVGLSSEATPADGLASTWYCAAGYLGADSPGDHWVIIANPTETRARAQLSVFPSEVVEVVVPEPTEGEDPGTELIVPPPAAEPTTVVVEPVIIEAGASVAVRLADLDGVVGDAAGALVESSGGILVEHRLVATAGDVTAPCSSRVGTTWLVGSGTTRRGARQVIVVFNPFPDEAVVSLQFATSTGVRAPSGYGSVTVLGRSVLPIDITDVVTLDEQVATTVTAQSGRVVVDRVVSLDGSDGASGLSVQPGVAGPAATWVLAGTRHQGVGGDAIVVYNPTGQEARVDIEVHPDPGSAVTSVEPISVTVPPGRAEVVVLSPAAFTYSRAGVTDASARLTAEGGTVADYWVGVRSLNEVEVIVDRAYGTAAAIVDAEDAEDGDPLAGATAGLVPGSPVAATRWMVGAGAGGLAIVNPGAEAIAQVSVAAVGPDGELVTVTVEVPVGTRVVVSPDELPVSSGPLVITSDEAVIVEALGTAAGLPGRPGVPVAGTWTPLVLPL